MKLGWRVSKVLLALFLVACSSSGVPRRVSDSAASLQQLGVEADGRWSIELRLQNYSSVPMRFETVALDLEIEGQPAGRLDAQPGLTIGPESADVVTLPFDPTPDARLLLAGRLADGRGVRYVLEGTVSAAPTDRGKTRDYKIKRDSQLAPVPGLPGVLR